MVRVRLPPGIWLRDVVRLRVRRDRGSGLLGARDSGWLLRLPRGARIWYRRCHRSVRNRRRQRLLGLGHGERCRANLHGPALPGRLRG